MIIFKQTLLYIYLITNGRCKITPKQIPIYQLLTRSKNRIRTKWLIIHYISFMTVFYAVIRVKDQTGLIFFSQNSASYLTQVHNLQNHLRLRVFPCTCRKNAISDHTETDSGKSEAAWHRRIRGLRPNSSTLSHEELDACDCLDEGDSEEFGRLVSDLRDQNVETFLLLLLYLLISKRWNNFGSTN